MAHEKKITSATRLDAVESRVEAMENSIARIESISTKIMGSLESLQNTPVMPLVAGKKANPEIYHYEHSGLDTKVVATNIEKTPDKTKGCFEILTALMQQFPNKVTVSAPHVKKDGSMGKSYILNLPRIDETFNLVDQTKSLAERKKDAKALWSAVAFNSMTFTGKYYQAGTGSVFTTYIKQGDVGKPLLNWLEKQGVHIPKIDHNKPKEGSED